jgi:PAS domain S-box-containing protein
MSTEKREFNILVVEDNPGDFALVEDFLLEQIEALTLVHAKNYRDAKSFLHKNNSPFDIVLLDISLPDKTGIPLIQEMVELCGNTPVIVLTGYTDFSFGATSLSLGVSDYILKEELTSISLYKSIIYSSERKKVISALEESEKKYSELFHLSPQPMWVFDLESLYFLNVNNAAIKHYGYSREEFLSMTISDIEPIEEIVKMEKALEIIKENDELIYQGNFIYRKKNGELVQVDTQSNIIKYRGKKAAVILAIDVTERSNYIKAIEQQNEKLREISWIQSHVVRAPLARIMGLVNIIKEMNVNNTEEQEIFDYMLLSANELDEAIRNITHKTKLVEEEKLSKIEMTFCKA